MLRIVRFDILKTGFDSKRLQKKILSNPWLVLHMPKSDQKERVKERLHFNILYEYFKVLYSEVCLYLLNCYFYKPYNDVSPRFHPHHHFMDIHVPKWQWHALVQRNLRVDRGKQNDLIPQRQCSGDAIDNESIHSSHLLRWVNDQAP